MKNSDQNHSSNNQPQRIEIAHVIQSLHRRLSIQLIIEAVSKSIRIM